MRRLLGWALDEHMQVVSGGGSAADDKPDTPGHCDLPTCCLVRKPPLYDDDSAV